MKPFARWLLVVLAVSFSLPLCVAADASAAVARPRGHWRLPRARWRRVAAERTVQALLAAGQRNLDNDEPAAAEKQFSAVLRIEPCNVAALIGRGIALGRLDRFDESLVNFQEAIRLDHGNSDAYAGRGAAYAGKGDFPRAFADCDKAIRLDPKNAHAYGGRGYAHLANDNLDKGIQDFDSAIELDPRYWRAFCCRGGAEVNTGQFDRAVRDFSEAIRLKPNIAANFPLRAVAWERKNEFAKALADFSEAIRIKPKEAKYYLDRADCCFRTKDFDRAIADVTTAIRLDPSNGQARWCRSMYYCEKNDLDRGIADLGEAIRLDPKCAYFIGVRCALYVAQRRLDKALADADAAIRLDPDNADWYRLRGSVYKEKKDAAHADADFVCCRRLDLAKLLRELNLPRADKQPKAVIDALEKRIKEQVKSLEYGDDVAQGVVTLVRDWDLIAFSLELDAASRNHKQGRLSTVELVKVEMKTAENLARMIKTLIWPVDLKKEAAGHDLKDVVRNKKACCQGDALLYYVLGNAIGLRTQGLEVALMADGPEPTGDSHDACLVGLADHSSIIVDPTGQLGGKKLVSRPFRIEDAYAPCGTYWKLKDESNPLGLHRVVVPADAECLIGQLCELRAYDYRRQGDRDKALSKAIEGVRRNPRSVVGYETDARFHSDSRDFQKAVADCTKAIAQNPVSARTYVLRSDCYANCGNFDQALTDLHKAQELNPKLSCLATARGRVYSQEGLLDKALAEFNKAIETNPSDAINYAGRAYVWSKKAQEERGLADVAARWASAPPYGEASSAPGAAIAATSSRGAGQTTAYGDGTIAAGTVATADPLGRVAPTNAAGLATSCSDAFSWSGSSTSVFDLHSFSLPGSPDQAAAAEIQAMKEGSVRKYLQAFKEDIAKAVADYSEAIRLDPKFVGAYRFRAYLYAWDGKLDLAIADLTEAIRYDAKNIVLLQERCKMYETKGDLDKAIADLTEIIGLDPKTAVNYTARAALYAKKHDTDKAAADLAEAERLHPSDDRYR